MAKIFRSLVMPAAVLAVALTGTMPARGQAQPSPEALNTARNLVSVMTVKLVSDAISSMTAQLWPSMQSSLRAQNPQLDQTTLDELRREFERLMAIHYEEVMRDAPAIYAKYFTADEMRALISFYRTPLGEKTLKVLPQAMADLTARMLPRMQGLQERVNLAFLNILQKRGLYAQ